MKSHKLIPALALCSILLFSGCFLKSVHPLVTSKDAIFLEGLEGVWETDDQRWTFYNDPASIPTMNISGSNFLGEFSVESDTNSTVFSDQNIYLIMLENFEHSSPDTTLFIGFIGEFSGHNFLDLSLLEAGLSNDNFYSAHLFPVHTFSRISLHSDELNIEFFKDSWIKNLILNNRVRIKHERIPTQIADTDEDILITASTDELQKFVSKFSSDERAFDKPIELTRTINEL